MTDLDKFKMLFKELDILFNVKDDAGQLIIEIDESAICDYGYGSALYIKFDDEGKFKEFEPWGE